MGITSFQSYGRQYFHGLTPKLMVQDGTGGMGGDFL